MYVGASSLAYIITALKRAEINRKNFYIEVKE